MGSASRTSTGEILIPSKSGPYERVPLPVDDGEMIAAYQTRLSWKRSQRMVGRASWTSEGREIGRYKMESGNDAKSDG